MIEDEFDLFGRYNYLGVGCQLDKDISFKSEYLTTSHKYKFIFTKYKLKNSNTYYMCICDIVSYYNNQVVFSLEFRQTMHTKRPQSEILLFIQELNNIVNNDRDRYIMLRRCLGPKEYNNYVFELKRVIDYTPYVVYPNSPIYFNIYYNLFIKRFKTRSYRNIKVSGNLTYCRDMASSTKYSNEIVNVPLSLDDIINLTNILTYLNNISEYNN